MLILGVRIWDFSSREGAKTSFYSSHFDGFQHEGGNTRILAETHILVYFNTKSFKQTSKSYYLFLAPQLCYGDIAFVFETTELVGQTNFIRVSFFVLKNLFSALLTLKFSQYSNFKHFCVEYNPLNIAQRLNCLWAIF